MYTQKHALHLLTVQSQPTRTLAIPIASVRVGCDCTVNKYKIYLFHQLLNFCRVIMFLFYIPQKILPTVAYFSKICYVTEGV
jgi:hypothetical protein